MHVSSISTREHITMNKLYAKGTSAFYKISYLLLQTVANPLPTRPKINKTRNVRTTQQLAAFANHCCHSNAINTTHSSVCGRTRAWVRACVFARASMGVCVCPGAWAHVHLLIQHARRIRHIVSYVASMAPPYFPTLSHKRHDFRKKLLKIKCVFSFSLQPLSNTFLILRRI